jgi:hypothetical protein
VYLREEREARVGRRKMSKRVRARVRGGAFPPPGPPLSPGQRVAALQRAPAELRHGQRFRIFAVWRPAAASVARDSGRAEIGARVGKHRTRARVPRVQRGGDLPAAAHALQHAQRQPVQGKMKVMGRDRGELLCYFLRSGGGKASNSVETCEGSSAVSEVKRRQKTDDR